MLKIGITGGIGSGKTIICKAFGALGIPVYYADIQAKQLIHTHPALRTKLTEAFGRDTFTNQGYNTQYVASIVFTHPTELQKLNSIVHPFVKADHAAWFLRQQAPYTLYEAAVLFENGGANQMDQVILVDAPEELRISRVEQRDGMSREAILSRIANQWPADKKRAMADWVIENNDKQLLLPQILSIHNELTEQ